MRRIGASAMLCPGCTREPATRRCPRSFRRRGNLSLGASRSPKVRHGACDAARCWYDVVRSTGLVGVLEDPYLVLVEDHLCGAGLDRNRVETPATVTARRRPVPRPS